MELAQTDHDWVLKIQILPYELSELMPLMIFKDESSDKSLMEKLRLIDMLDHDEKNPSSIS